MRDRGRGRAQGAEGWRTFEEVVTQHLDALFRTALRLTRGHTANAEDLLQDAMLRACEGYDELRDPGAARTWLFTILMRTHFNRQRSAKRHPEALASELTDAEFEKALADWPGIGTGHVSGDGWPSTEKVGEAIDALDEALRAVVVLVDVQGFRQREAAAMLGLPEGTVASRLFRARRQLRDALTVASNAVPRPGHGSQ
jgi:RNA polymerase sigma-70 factor (ECF subfamily)